jgi:hypothetical protein
LDTPPATWFSIGGNTAMNVRRALHHVLVVAVGIQRTTPGAATTISVLTVCHNGSEQGEVDAFFATHVTKFNQYLSFCFHLISNRGVKRWKVL